MLAKQRVSARGSRRRRQNHIGEHSSAVRSYTDKEEKADRSGEQPGLLGGDFEIHARVHSGAPPPTRCRGWGLPDSEPHPAPPGPHPAR